MIKYLRVECNEYRDKIDVKEVTLEEIISQYSRELEGLGWTAPIFLFTVPRYVSKAANMETRKDKEETLHIARILVIFSPIYPLAQDFADNVLDIEMQFQEFPSEN